MNNIRVVTYNLLSSELSTATRYKYPFRRKDINPRYRMEKLQNEITQFVIGRYWDGNTHQFNSLLKNPIFCFQEVSTEWHSELKIFFHKLKYEFECTNYGNYHNGDMGVAIAYPKCYELLDYRIGRVTKNCKWKCNDESGKSSSSSDDEIEGSPNSSYLKCIASEQERHRRIWEVVKHCKNRYITLKLRIYNQSVWISTFHMPCAWDCTPMMMATLMLLLKELNYIVKDERHILGGDFNFMPDSAMFKYMLTGNTEVGDLPFSFGRPYNWKFFSSPMNVVDPLPYTTKTFGCIEGKEFCGSIDHIFYSGSGLQYIRTEKSEPPLDKIYMPNGKHPSDHLPVIAQFSLYDGERE